MRHRKLCAGGVEKQKRDCVFLTCWIITFVCRQRNATSGLDIPAVVTTVGTKDEIVVFIACGHRWRIVCTSLLGLSLGLLHCLGSESTGAIVSRRAAGTSVTRPQKKHTPHKLSSLVIYFFHGTLWSEFLPSFSVTLNETTDWYKIIKKKYWLGVCGVISSLTHKRSVLLLIFFGVSDNSTFHGTEKCTVELKLKRQKHSVISITQRKWLQYATYSLCSEPTAL